ncbi:hypothetical protein R3P38DRAFT_2861998 [Favolaschia claudopus]|uniref:F-box domain-containing protein n=1 Tax=Favolaschia claudopus TaxID=2862362 RepID=A0AAW0DI59_9AGAR
MHPALARFTDLPDELIISIFEDPEFSVESLYFMALLSRRLHRIALAIYFSRHKIDLNTKKLTVYLKADDSLDTLSFLRLSLHIDSLEYLSCTIPHPSCTVIHPVVNQMNRLRSLISRLSSIGQVVLIFADGHASQTYHCLAFGDDARLRTWAHTLGGLLRDILQAGCKHLTVVNGSYLTGSYEILPVSSSPLFIKRILYPHSSTAPGFRRSWPQGTEDTRVPVLDPSSKDPFLLSSLCIESPIFLIPPAFDWTLSALRHAPITSLTIAVPSARLRDSTELWTHILPSIAFTAAPHLTDLKLTEVEAHHADLVLSVLVANLPHLTTLDIDFLHWFWHLELSAPPKTSRRSLRRLTSLRTIPILAQHLLSRWSLPALRNLTLIWWIPDGQASEFHFVRPVLSVMRTLSKSPSLVAWRRRPSSVHISLSIRTRQSIQSFADRVLSYLLLPHSDSLANFFRLVERIEMTGLYVSYISPLKHRDPLLKFLDLFSQVEELKLQTSGSFGEAKDLVNGLQAHATLRRIVVDGDVYSLSAGPV